MRWQTSFTLKSALPKSTWVEPGSQTSSCVACACCACRTGLDIALDNAVGAVKAFLLTETVENPLGRVLLLLPDLLALCQPF